MKDLYKAHSDDMLVSLLASSDRRAFTEIYRRYWEKLFFIAGKKVIDMGEAESLVHDVLSDLWFRRANLQITSSLNNYLAASLKYCVIKLFHQQRKLAASSFPEQHLLLVDRDTPETIVGFEQLKSKLEQLVKDLPGQCRLAFQLKQDGLSQRQIAAEMQIAEHTVERHLSRAYKSLRSSMLQYLKLFL